MPPAQFPAPQPQQPQPSPYDFFMEQQSPQKKSLFSGGKFIWLAIVALVGIILIGIVLAIASSEDTSTVSLVSIAQKQDELIRVATSGNKNARSTPLKNFAVTTQVTMRSSQKDMVAYISKHGTKLDAKTLALGMNPQTDKALAAAQAANTYDVTFASTMRSELSSYVKAIDQATTAATTRTEKALLQKQNANAQLLTTMLTQQ